MIQGQLKTMSLQTRRPQRILPLNAQPLTTDSGTSVTPSPHTHHLWIILISLAVSTGTSARCVALGFTLDPGMGRHHGKEGMWGEGGHRESGQKVKEIVRLEEASSGRERWREREGATSRKDEERREEVVRYGQKEGGEWMGREYSQCWSKQKERHNYSETRASMYHYIKVDVKTWELSEDRGWAWWHPCNTSESQGWGRRIARSSPFSAT